MTVEATKRSLTDEAAKDLSASGPSAGLLTAALAGLLVVGASGCGDDENGGLICESPTAPPPPNADPPATAWVDAGVSPPQPAATPDAGRFVEITQELEVFRAMASLRNECDSLGGYVQIHAACAGSNSCQGFSYWSPKPGVSGPGVFTSHSCSAANGCRGASCVVMPKDRGRTGKEVYEDENLPEFGPSRCGACHAVNGPNHGDPADYTKFKVWLMPGDTSRNANNWLQKSAAEQEAIVAFGKNSFFAEGTAQAGTAMVNMVGYHKLLSREEIKKVVAHIRTLQPLIETVPTPPEVEPR